MHVLLAEKFHNFATRETLLWERDCVLLVCGISHFSCVQLLATLWSVAHQAPMSMDFPGKNTGMGFHALLQGIFPTQRSNPHLLHLLHRQAVFFFVCFVFLPLAPSGKWCSPYLLQIINLSFFQSLAWLCLSAWHPSGGEPSFRVTHARHAHVVPPETVMWNMIPSPL